MSGNADSVGPYRVLRDEAPDERVRSGWRLDGPGLSAGSGRRFAFDESRERLADIAALMNFAFAQGEAALASGQGKKNEAPAGAGKA